MIDFFAENIGTVVVFLIIAGVCALAVRSMIKDKKNGKSCGGNCKSCSACHGHSNTKE